MNQGKVRFSKLPTFQSKLSVQYFHQLIPEVTTKTRRQKRIEQIEEYVQTYEIFLKLLLGQDINEKEEKIIMLKNLNKQIEDNTVFSLDLPEAVVSLPNPDQIPDDFNSPLRQLEIFDLITKSLCVDESSIKDKLFVKALENAFTHLADKKIYSLFELKSRGVESNQLQIRNTLTLIGTAQQLFQKSPDRSPRSLILVDNVNNQINPTEFQLYQRDDQVKKLVRKFRKYLRENVDVNLGSVTNITDYLQLDVQKMIYVQKKAYSQGEYLKQQGSHWYRTRNETSDILTLIRNALIIKLSLKGFQVRQFISKDAKIIFLCLYMPEKMLETAAENCKLQKKLSFCYTDILSLEPVDKQYRPLRLNGRLWKPDEYDNTSYLEYLRPLIVSLIEEINFKRLAREVGQSGLNIELFEYGKSDLYGDFEGPTDDEWTAYYKYLVHLNKHVQTYRKNSKIESDLALCIDEQMTIEELYRLRNQTKNSTQLKFQDFDNQQIDLQKEKIQKLLQESSFITVEIPVIKKIKLYKQSQLAHSYFYAFKESLKVANCSQILLKTIWDRYQQKPFELYVPFQLNFIGQSIKNIVKQYLKWSRYVKNEENQTSLFSANERLKLAQQVIAQTINLNQLVSLQFVNQYFCLHDQYELFGYCRNISKAIGEDKLNYKKKPFDIFSEWQLDLLHPWQMPNEKISNYFGEYIGIFFEFSTYFIKNQTPLAAFGSLFSVILYSAENVNQDVYSASIGIFSQLIVFTNSYIAAFWDQKRLIFNLRTGQNKNVEENLVRSNFKGQYIRSIENDQLNSKGVNFTKFVQRLIISIFILFFLIGSNIGIMIGLYFFNYFLKLLFEEKDIGFSNFEIIISATINYFIQSLLDRFYQQIAVLLSDFENFQTISDYEASYILKKFCLQSVAKLGPMLILFFLCIPLELYCQNEQCQAQVQFFVGTTTMLFFFTKASQLIVLQFNTKIKYPTRIFIRDHFSLWEFIENQEQREQCVKESEMNFIINEQMDFFILQTLTNIFGSLFPFSQTLLWIWTIIQTQILKFKLAFIFQRSWPKGQSSLGVWEELNQLLSFITLLCNTGLICIQYSNHVNDQIVLLFLSLLFSNILIKFMVYSVFGSTPLILEQLIRRGKYLYKSNIQIKSNLSRGTAKINKEGLQKCPLFKIFGSNSFLSNNYFETISSDDEIQDHYQHNSKIIAKHMALEEEMKIHKMKDLATDPEPQPILNLTQVQSKKTISEEPSKSLVQITKQLERQETYMRKKIGQRIKDYQKKISIVQKLDYKFLSEFYSKRAIHWAFKVQTSKKGEKQLIKDKTNIWKFFFRLRLLSNYNLYWGDYRLYVSQSFIPRKRKMFQNLDLKRYQILKQAFDRENENYKNVAFTKFRRKFQQFGNTLTAEEVKEYNNLVYKYQNFIEKRSWLNCRKVQTFRFKALFFKGFRKQTLRKQSYQYALEYYEATKKLNEIQYESDIHKKFSTLVQYSSINQYSLDQFIDLFNKLEYEQKTSYIFPLANTRINQKIYHSQSLKSDIYKNVIDKSKDTYIFEQQNQKVEEFAFQYFIDEINQIPNIKMKKHLHDILWLVDVDNKNYLMQFFQVRHGQQLQFLKYHNDGLGIFIGESQNYIRLLNIIDQIDDFFIKGYCVSLYEYGDEECKSLFQVLQFRKKYSLNYTLDDLKQFLFANLVLLTKTKLNNISIYNYILVNNEYMILNSIVEPNNNLIHQLVQVIIEMILLEPVEDYLKTLEHLEHPLKYLLYDILKSNKTPNQLLDLMLDQKSFSDINFKQAPHQKNHTYQQHMEFMKHQINFYLRMKQFQKSLSLIRETEEFIRINNFHTTQELLPFFINFFSKNLSNYILKSNEIKKILDTLLLFYFKICSLFALRKDFSGEIILLIDSLKKCSAQIRVLFRQLNLNVKLENLSEIEQCIILKRKLKQISEQQSSISSFERLNLINTLRKNQDYIMIILQYQTQLQRYLNQLRVINAIDNYFKKNYVMASIQYAEVISNQEQLVMREPAPTVLNIPIDHSPGLINFEQTSPVEDDQLATANTETNSNTLIHGDQLYCSQLIFFKFLNLVNLYDSKNEQFEYYFNDFLELDGVNDNVFQFYLTQLKILKLSEITKVQIEDDLNCEVGKFVYLKNLRWIEVCFEQFSDLIYDRELVFNKFQILTLSNINLTIDNRSFLKQLINQRAQQNLSMIDCLYQIKAIQQLLHLDHFQPVSHSIQKNIKIKSTTHSSHNSYIYLLQEYHLQLKFRQDSWFYHEGLEEVQMFYYLSTCFAFSPKHFENLGKLSQGNNELVENAVRQIKKFQSKPKFYCQILKCTQINNKFAQKFLYDQSLTNYQQYQIFCQYLNCSLKQHSTIKISYQQIKENFGDKLTPSIIVLGLIQSFITFQQFDMVDLILQFSQRLFQSQAFIYHKVHEGFEKDLQFIECVYQDKKQHIPYPAQYLYEYTKDFKYFENIKFNYQYQLFNMTMHQDYNLLYEIISENLYQISQQQSGNLIRFKDLFISYQEAVKAMIGLVEPQTQYYIKLNDYKEGTLMYALLAHFQCKFHLNMIDYESALKYCEKTLKYISTSLKNQHIVVSISNDNLSQEYPIHQTLKQLQIEDYDYLIEEQYDSDYIHLLNNDLINDAILNYLRIKINLYKEPPNISLLFSLQLILENTLHISYLQLIFAEYFVYFMNSEENQLEQQLGQDSLDKIDEIKQKINKEEQKQKACYSLKLNIFNDFTFIDQKLKILDFQLNLYINSTNCISKKLINNLANQCAQKAIDGYLKILPANRKVVHPYVSLMYLIQCESYQFLNQIQKAQNMLDQAEISLKAWFDDYKHPLKGLFFFHQGNHCRWLYEQYMTCIKETISLRMFDAIEMKTISQGLINQDPLIIKTFDYFHQNIIKQIASHLKNFVFQQIGKHEKQNIFYKYTEDDAQDILDDVLFMSSIRELNGITQFLDALAIFNHFETEHRCIDIIKRLVTD